LNKRTTISLAIILLVLIIDQSVKFWVKTHMNYGDLIPIIPGSSHAYIHFVENPGMAFGMELGGIWGKILLTLLRIIFILALGGGLHFLIKDKAPIPFIVAVSLILAGALGNIIDSIFYGVLFSASPYHGGVAQFLPPEGGYAPLLRGKVVDMFYFPLIRTTLPEWVPFLGGSPLSFSAPSSMWLTPLFP